jgi:hypothetical protein
LVFLFRLFSFSPNKSLLWEFFFPQVTLISSKAPLYIFPRIHFFF